MCAFFLTAIVTIVENISRLKQLFILDVDSLKETFSLLIVCSVWRSS